MLSEESGEELFPEKGMAGSVTCHQEDSKYS